MEQRENQTLASLPAYYDANYVEKALSQAYNSPSLRVTSLHGEPITKRGENFCSSIYRLKVEYRKSPTDPPETGSFIIKDLIPFMADLGSNEKVMFEHLLPAMGQILEKGSSTLHENKLNAICLSAERAKSKEIYLLEDLEALGYASVDRHVGVSLETALLCLRKVAQFHAASMVLLLEQPELVAQLAPSHFATGLNDFSHSLTIDGTAFAADIVAKMPGMEMIAGKMKKQLQTDFVERMKTVVSSQNCSFNVIAHGDLWINNVLINSEKKEAILVDFQDCFLGSPAIDLHFFFYTSLQLDVLLHQQENLLQHYHQSLCETLSACNYTGTIPSFTQLKSEMQRCLFFGYYSVVCELPLCSATKKASTDFTAYTFMDSQAILAKRHQLFANKRVRLTLQATLKHFEEQGILN